MSLQQRKTGKRKPFYLKKTKNSSSHTHTSFVAALYFNLMALNLGLGLGSTSLILLTTSFKGTSWGSSDAARSYDAQRPVLPAPVARAAV